ncbi:MAG: hypothetical protein PHQ28_03965 [Mycobacterium sp.]|nr:hypothetical protein [Mycobacterium sp.]
MLLAWPTDHLTEAASHWEIVAERSYALVHQVWRDATSIDWRGQAAEALRTVTHADMQTTSAAADQLHAAARLARSGASDLYAARSRVRYAVEDAHTAGFEVGEDLSVIDRTTGGSTAQRAAQAHAFAGDIRQRAAQLVALDQQVARKITAAVAEIGDVFLENPTTPTPDTSCDHEPRIRAVDLHTFKDAPNPEPEPPPGGWSGDPLMRAAQKIAYGHASGTKGHMEQFSGMTKDQLADLIHDMFTRDPKDLIVGRTSDGAPALYDPKTNVLVIRDPHGLDCGTVFKPDKGLRYLLGDQNGPGKIVVRQPSLAPDDLADKPLPAPALVRPAAPPAESAPGPKSGVSPPKVGEGPTFGGAPGPFGPQVIRPPHSIPHHLPILGEDEPWENPRDFK